MAFAGFRFIDNEGTLQKAFSQNRYFSFGYFEIAAHSKGQKFGKLSLKDEIRRKKKSEDFVKCTFVVDHQKSEKKRRQQKCVSCDYLINKISLFSSFRHQLDDALR